jgi:hypothetical protein
MGVLLFAALLSACDTTQPLQYDEQTYELQFDGRGATVPTYDVWDQYEDENGNGAPDPGEPMQLFCADQSAPDTISPTSAPFSFTLQITILRAGETVKERVTSESALAVGANLSGYDDPSNIITGVTPDKAPIVVDGRRFIFRNPRRVSAANRDVVMATVNTLNQLRPGTYFVGNGLCSAGNPGAARIDNEPQPLALVLRKGDTIIVEARRGIDPPNGVPYDSEPSIRALFLLDGREVSVNGSDRTTKQPGSALSFSFTSI